MHEKGAVVYRIVHDLDTMVFVCLLFLFFGYFFLLLSFLLVDRTLKSNYSFLFTCVCVLQRERERQRQRQRQTETETDRELELENFTRIVV